MARGGVAAEGSGRGRRRTAPTSPPVPPPAVSASPPTERPPWSRSLASAYCRHSGDLVAAAEDAQIAMDDARAALRSPWWHDEMADYWQEHAPNATQASIAIRYVLSEHQRGKVDHDVGIRAAKVALDKHSQDRAVSMLAPIVGQAAHGEASAALAELMRRNLLRLPPEQHRIALQHAEMLRDCYAPPLDDDPPGGE